MRNFKFLNNTLNYKVHFVSGAEYDESIRAQYRIVVYIENREYEITLIANQYYTELIGRIENVMRCYDSSDSIEVLIAHLRIVFIDAFIKDNEV